MKEIFLNAEQVAAELGVSKSYAYKLIQKLNQELKELGCITIRGRVDRKYFHDHIYQQSEAPGASICHLLDHRT